MSTFAAIMIYAAGVLVALVGVSGAFVLAAGWVVRHTDPGDAAH